MSQLAVDKFFSDVNAICYVIPVLCKTSRFPIPVSAVISVSILFFPFHLFINDKICHVKDFKVSMLCYHILLFSCSRNCKRYSTSKDIRIFCVLCQVNADSKGLQAVRLSTNKILQFSTGGAG